MVDQQDTLLVIDDEVDILKAVERLFRRRYNVLTAQTTDHARKVLEEHDVHVILCDQRLPRETGVTFFSDIRHIYPDIVRVLFTGYANIDSVIDAINEGAVYRYISKPWQPSELKIVIDQAFDQYRQKRERQQLLAQLQQANEELTRANTELTQIDEVRRVFMEVISHELNTPIAIITGYTYLLRREIDAQNDPIMQKSLDRIETSSNRLKRISERIFQMIDDNNPKHTLKLTTFHIRDLVSALHAQVEPFLQKRNLRLMATLQDGGEQLEADFEKLLDALLNITMNAIKFSEDGKTIHLNVQDNPEDTSRTQISIEDQGIGINEEDFPQIFTAFFSSFNTANHSSGEYEFKKRGVGLGLSLAQKFIHMHHGTIEATSAEGKGSCFVVDIPKKYQSG